MRLTSQLLVAGGLAPLTHAFPRMMYEAAANDPAIVARAEEIQEQHKRQAGADAAAALFEPINTFNAEAQYIDVSAGSGHEYVPPGAGDLRGPCPGLNAFANHNFLPHNGYASVLQYIDATTKVVGMGPNLALFLSVYGGAIDGDILNWSMGGTPSLAQGGATGILANGLIGSHNKYESDASPTRPDLYQAGNNYLVVESQFQDLINHSPGSVTIDSLTAFRSDRFDQQIANNPYFFNGPFTGVLVQPAAYTFIYRFMANHSAEYPEGYLSYDTLKSWFGVTGQSGSYKATPGTEQIPANWYRRAIEYPYDTDYFVADVLNAALLHPKFLDIGGNLGKTNSFAGVDVANLTGGLYNSADLLKDNNLGCFVYQLSAQAKPDVVLGALTKLTNAIGDIIGPLNCPKLQAIDDAQLAQFPGYQKQPAFP